MLSFSGHKKTYFSLIMLSCDIFLINCVFLKELPKLKQSFIGIYLQNYGPIFREFLLFVQEFSNKD